MKELIRKLLLLTCICVFVYSAYQLTSIYFEYKEIEKDTESLITDYVEEPTIENDEGQEVDKSGETIEKLNVLERVIRFDELLKINEDIVGWIYIPGTRIDEPLLQGENNDTYLRTDYKKKKNSAGSIFIDEGNYSDLMDSNTIIHGHNMRNGSRFHNLRYFVRNDYYKNHPYIYIYLPDGSVNIYEIYAASKINATSVLYNRYVDYTSYIRDVQKEASQKTAVSSERKPLIMLSTCYDSGSNQRYAVFARLKENVPTGNQN